MGELAPLEANLAHHYRRGGGLCPLHRGQTALGGCNTRFGGLRQLCRGFGAHASAHIARRRRCAGGSMGDQ